MDTDLGGSHRDHQHESSEVADPPNVCAEGLCSHNGKTEGHLCEHCGKTFAKKRDYIKHKRKHNGEKPYKCQHCNKTFTYKSQCIIHERIHTGEKTYPCPIVGSFFEINMPALFMKEFIQVKNLSSANIVTSILV